MIAPPGPSFVTEEPVLPHGAAGQAGRKLRAGLTDPSVMDDGWWLTHVWLADDDGIIDAGDYRVAFFKDPDGLRLEVYVPTGADGAPAPTGQEPTCGFF